ncbi:hypothetical protein [Saccharicrinis fermentans]|uniref:Uncharacterized protein n=1 Tax=Saccharicrinis fermentans DSM 9555 = JCM 21142 TaxID=869213 RepID=W7YLJ8_9BACT|nr:hypothetical protein [Saccharicrinis fermentans]GAF05461.1 hypothetical protein JCM21142_104196 [Saccharicrinis fermentans DSM 9555 = JCM 21142]
MTLIESYQHKGDGYNPFLIRPGWQVAQLNHAAEEELEAISCLDVHYKTDEVFILIEGEAVLIAASVSNNCIEYDLQVMKQGITYNIPRNVWHKIAMQKGSKVIIVENDYTHLPLPDGDYGFYYLSEDRKADLRSQVNQILNQ